MYITDLFRTFVYHQKREAMITTMQFKTLDDLYKYYNTVLFEGSLADCIVNLSRDKRSFGFFAANRWEKAGEADTAVVHEISINPDYMTRTDKAWHSTLVHEMCHLWQWDAGKPSRRGYHNKEWALKMQEVGLMPSDTGAPEGLKVGQSMSHYVIEGGAYEQAFNTLSDEDLKNLRLQYKPAFSGEDLTPGRKRGGGTEAGTEEGEGEQEPKSGKRQKYTCSCENKVWGKSGLKLFCPDCDTYYQEGEA